LADFAGDAAFFRFASFLVEDFSDFCGAVSQQVVDVPEPALFSSEVPLDSLLQIPLCGTHVSVRALAEGYAAEGADAHGDAFIYAD
jgi:hypothetical protein